MPARGRLRDRPANQAPPEPSLTLRDRLLGWRDRLLASPRFHRIVFANPILRQIGRRRSRELFDICAGFVYSQTLLACVRSGVLEALQKKPMTAAELGQITDFPEPAMERLLRAAQALHLVGARSHQRYGLGELGAALLANAGLREMITHHPRLYDDLREPETLLRLGEGRGSLASYWPYAGTDQPDLLSADRTRPYSQLMAATLPAVAAEILDAYPITKHRMLLDIGGGDGAFLRAAAAVAPDMHLMLFDLPSVVEEATLAFAGAGQTGRSRVVGGDFRIGQLPEGADLISLVRILLDHDDTVATALLHSAARALEPGGRILIAEPMSAGPGQDRVTDAYFGFYLFAMGRGRARSVTEIFAMLRAAGFINCKVIRNQNPVLVRIVTAEAPSLS